MLVVLLLALIWSAVLVPPALRAHAARQDAFLVSLGQTRAPDLPPPRRPRSRPVQVRRRIAGGLLVAMAGTFLVGLLPTFRVFLIVHLFLVDSFIAYVALLAHMANRAARTKEAVVEGGAVADRRGPAPTRRRLLRRVTGPVVLPDFGPMAPAG